MTASQLALNDEWGNIPLVLEPDACEAHTRRSAGGRKRGVLQQLSSLKVLLRNAPFKNLENVKANLSK
jgi:hypothetical protein